jgi:hypothetical protein
MRVFDGLKLASAIISKPDIFIVSDKNLSKSAGKELSRVEFIG